MLLPYIIDRGPLYGKRLLGRMSEVNGVDTERKKVVVEFSSPNLGKAFDGLHLRSTIVGAFIASIHESMGWKVCRMNFLGDWGKHIGLLVAGWPRFGSDEAFEADPLRHLLDVYTQADELLKLRQVPPETTHEEQVDAVRPGAYELEAEKDECIKRLEDGDLDALTLWRRFRESLRHKIHRVV